MAKIDEENFTTKYQGKVHGLQKRIEHIELLKRQRTAWASQRFLAKGKGNRPHTVHVSAASYPELPPIDVPVPRGFIENIIEALSLRIEKGEHEVAEAIREFAAEPRRGRGAR